MLLVNSPPQVEELVSLGREQHVPVVALSSGGQVDYSVRVDHRGYVRAAAEFLRRRGRARIGLIYNRTGVAFREEGVAARTLAEGGCQAEPRWIIGCVQDQRGGFEADERAGYEAAGLLPLDELDGLIISDDVIGVGVDRRLAEMGVDVPEKLMVATWWSSGSRLRLTLPFERFETDVEKQAKLGFDLLQDLIGGQRVSDPHLRIVPARVSNAVEMSHATK